MAYASEKWGPESFDHYMGSISTSNQPTVLQFRPVIRESGVVESNRRYLLERLLLAGGSDAEGQLWVGCCHSRLAASDPNQLLATGNSRPKAACRIRLKSPESGRSRTGSRRPLADAPSVSRKPEAIHFYVRSNTLGGLAPSSPWIRGKINTVLNV